MLAGIEEVRDWVLESCPPRPPVRVPLGRALGLVLAEPVCSAEAVPPFTNSSVDGYAVRSADVAGAPTRLREAGTLMAGDDPRRSEVRPGEALRVMTGAALPLGADAVCMVEHSHREDGWVVIELSAGPGTNVRYAGDDITPGEEVFAAGTRLAPAHVGVLTSLGIEAVLAHPRPRVGVMSTGDELMKGPGPLTPGKIRDSNRPGLLGQLGADGFEALDLGWVPDEPAALVAKLEQAAEHCDAVLTSGGVSVGDRDIVRLALQDLKASRARWWQVALKPGKPFAFASLHPSRVAVFGLPGNPVSALVSYEMFARPALRSMAGYHHLERPRLAAVAEVDFKRRPDGRLHLVRVKLFAGPDGVLMARPSGGQGSHQLRALADANALALLPDGDGVAAGGVLVAWLLDPEGLWAEGDGGRGALP